MSDESDAKQILTASPLENWRRPLGRPWCLLCSTVYSIQSKRHRPTFSIKTHFSQSGGMLCY